MKPRPHLSRQFTHSLLVIALLISLGGFETARGAVLTRDANPGTSGAQNGNGTWNTSNNNWTNGVTDVSWNNATPDSADFSSKNPSLSFTVTLGEKITTAGITVQNASRVITLNGGYTLNLGSGAIDPVGGGHSIVVNTPIALTANGGWNQQVSSQIIVNGTISGGFSISKNGVGGLTLNGPNTFSGELTSTQSNLYLGHDQAAGTGGIDLGAAGSHEWNAINGNRTLANPLTTLTGIQPSDYIVFAGANFRFTPPDGLGIQSTTGGATPTTGLLTFTVNNSQVVFDGGLTNTSSAANAQVGIAKDGPGTLIIHGNSKFDGDSGLPDAVTVTAGALLFNGTVTTHTGTGQRSYQINSGGTFGGSGTITLAVTSAFNVNGGTLPPGNSVGMLTITGSTILSDSSTYVYEAADLINVDGALTLPTGPWNIDLIGNVGRGLQTGGSLVLFTFDSFTNIGTFNQNPNVTPSNWIWPVPLGATSVSIVGNGVLLNGVSVIPESRQPCSCWAAAAGCCGAGYSTPTGEPEAPRAVFTLLR